MKLLNSNKTRDKKNHELEFLAAALEIQETPATPIGRLILWLIMLFFTIAIAWAFLGEVDIVSVAHGKIIPSGHVKVIQPVETSVVKRILVKEGAQVTSGQLLIELDNTMAGADQERLIDEMKAAGIDRVRVQALLDMIKTTVNFDVIEQWKTLPNKERSAAYLKDIIIPVTTVELHQPQGILPQQLAIHQQRAEQEYREFVAQLASLVDQLEQRHAETAAARTRIQELNATIPLVSERANSLKTLVERQLVARAKWLELEQERIEKVKEREAKQDEIRMLAAAIGSIQQQIRAAQSQKLHELLQQLTELDTRLLGYQQEIVKAEQRDMLHHLRAPIDGYVQQLSVHTVGGVVTPAQELMRIVPGNEYLEVEAWVPNKDIGFVEVGDTAEVKIEAFPFTKYGFIDGHIERLSNDAVSDEQAGLIFPMQVSLKQNHIAVAGKDVGLTPGMSVTVEVMTGKRRIIEYLLSPLLRYKQESIRER